MEDNIKQNMAQETNQEAPPQVEELVVTQDNILDLLTSKSFRHRIAAYQRINEYPQHISLLQNETMAAALDTALDALLGCSEQLSNGKIAGLYSQFGQNKQTIKSKLSMLIDKVFLNDKLGVLDGLVQSFSHKNSKVVSAAVSKSNALISGDIDSFKSKDYTKYLSENICTKLQMLTSHTDKDVREEGSKLILTLYRIFYDGILKYLVDVKPIVMKDLQTAFSQVEMPKRDIKLSDADFDSPDWKTRLSAMTFLRDSIPRMNNTSDIVSIISRRIRDANLSVAMVAIECVKAGRIQNPECIRGLIDRFKDKKAAVNQLISDTIQTSMPDVNILMDALVNKNPEVKAKVLECLKFYSLTRRIEEVGKLLEDSSPVVRKAAVDLLSGVADLSDLTDSQKAKVPVADKKKDSEALLKAKQEIIPESPTRNTPVNDSVIKTSRISTPEKTSKCKSADIFLDKFPSMFDKDWTRRLEFIQENKDAIKSVGSRNLISFIVSCKENNVTIMKELMCILSSFDDLTENMVDLGSFLITKITEAKLKDSIVAIFKKVDSSVIIPFILQHLEQGKVGKRFISLLEVLGAIAPGQNEAIDRFLEKVKVFGMSEKKALSDFTDQYKTGVVSRPGGLSHSSTLCDSAGFDDDSRIFRKDAKPEGSVNEAFTKEFLERFKKETLSAVGMLEKVDIRKHGGLMLKLYREFELPSPYFNSLILHLISRKYILTDVEASDLISYLLAKKMEAEIDLLDRIYPATRLYKILKTVPGSSTIEAIFNLIKKYKDMNGISLFDVENAMKDSDDFISFSLSIDKITELKKNIKDRFEQVSERRQTLRSSTTTEIAAEMSYLCLNEKEEDPIASDDSNLNDLEDSVIIERAIVDNLGEEQLREDCHGQSNNFGSGILKFPEVKDDQPLPDNQSPPHLSETTVILFPSAVTAEELKMENKAPAVSLTDDFRILSTKVDDADISYEIEKSLENISISTTPHKKKRNISEAEDLLLLITDRRNEKSTEGLHKLIRTIAAAPNTIIFSANTIITTVSLQLMCRYNDSQYRKTALEAFLKLTQNGGFCSCLRYDTLRSIHTDLIPLVKDETTVADILINLCLNCELLILKVYFDLLEDANEVLMRLIWRHAKRVNYTSVETAAAIVKILNEFFEEKKKMFVTADNIVIKVCLLHLKECIAAFSDNLKQFGVGATMESIINLLLTNAFFSMDDIRLIFR